MLKVFPTIVALRGAFLNFKEEFPEAKDLELEQISIFEYWKENYTFDELNNGVHSDVDCSINFPPVFDYNPFDGDNKIIFIRESLEYLITINAAYNRPDNEVYEFLRTCLKLNTALYAMVKREGIKSWKETESETATKNEMLKTLHDEWEAFKNTIPDYINTEDEDKIYREKMLDYNRHLMNIYFNSSNWTRLFNFAGVKDSFKNVSYDVFWKYHNTDAYC